MLIDNSLSFFYSYERWEMNEYNRNKTLEQMRRNDDSTGKVSHWSYYDDGYVDDHDEDVMIVIMIRWWWW